MWSIDKKVSKGEYVYAFLPDHPKATAKGYVLEHRAVMENALGRLLRDDEVVHHIDGDKKNNVESNLEVMTRGEHSSHHATEPVFVCLQCSECGVSFSRRANQRASLKGYKNVFCSRSCNGKFQRRQQLGQPHPVVSPPPSKRSSTE